jgi:hypothetical protein
VVSLCNRLKDMDDEYINNQVGPPPLNISCSVQPISRGILQWLEMGAEEAECSNVDSRRCIYHRYANKLSASPYKENPP